MKAFLFILLFAVAFVSFSYAQTGGSLAEDLKTLLPDGMHQAKLIGLAIPELTPRSKELQDKIMKAVMKNATWFRDSAKSSEDMEKMIEKMGVTPEEMEEYNKATSQGEGNIRVTGTDSLEVIRKGNSISFTGYGRLEAFDSLRIDLVAKTAVFRGQVMPYKVGSAKKGGDGLLKHVSGSYEFAYEPADPTGDAEHVIDNLIRYTVSVGRYDATGEAVVFLMAIKNVDKRNVLNISVACLLK